MRDYIYYKTRHNFILDRKIQEIQSLHQMDSCQLKEYENKTFLEVLNHAYRRSPFYKKYYNELGVDIHNIKSLDDISKLPIIDKDIVWQFKKEMLTCPYVYMFKGYTSGTSGSSLTVYRSLNAILTENAYIWNFRNMHGVYNGDKLVVIRGDLNRDQLFKYDKYANTLYLSSYNINEKTIHTYVKLLLDFNPKCIIGYPSSLEMLCNELYKININLHIPVAITSSETLFCFQREKIKKQLGSVTYDWYGNAERTVAIEQSGNNEYYFVPGYSVNEVFEDHMLTTSLFNKSFPLIRYKVNDVIELEGGKEKNGRSDNALASLKVEKILGRDDDYIFLPNGTKIGRMSKAFKGLDDILFAQIIQDEVNSITLNVVPAATRFDARELMKRLRLLLGDQILITLVLVTADKIIRTKAGKYKLVINSLFKKHQL